MTTVGDLVTRTRERWLNPGLRNPVNKLASTITASATSVVFTYDQSLDRNKLIGIDSEVMLVWAYDTSTKTATVERGWKGTTAAAHTSGALIDVDARWFRSDVLAALADVINGWPPALYQPVAATVSVVRGQTSINLPASLAGAYYLLDARVVDHPLITTTSYDRWKRLSSARIVNGFSAGVYASGTMIALGSGLPDRDVDVRLMAAMPFDTVPFEESNDVAAVGLSESLCDLACMGAAVRLIQGMEAGRSDRRAQGENRRATEVPPGTASQSAGALERSYRNRMRDEIQRLMASYPWRVG